MIIGVSSNLTALLVGLKVFFGSAKSSLISLLTSLGIWFSSTPFSTSAMGITCSGFLVVSRLRLVGTQISRMVD